MKRILLDTNAYSGFQRGDVHVLEEIAGADKIYLSIFVLAELYYGFKLGSQEQLNVTRLKEFSTKPNVTLLKGSQTTSLYFANIKLSLKRLGNPIPINDVWIAAQAMETGSVLISYDQHFKNIQGLLIWHRL